ncbi:MAG: cell division protein FtsZ [Candidatus Cloacimonetes bacterium]|nr:cell division protein FtsZ [Candidatus Cloacimonadota bacterium]
MDLEKDEFTVGKNIKIFGVGGAGGNAVNAMIHFDLKGVEFIVANTNISDLQISSAKSKLQLGKKLTKGLGAGSNPEVGRKAAEESKDEIMGHLDGAELVFIAAGMGGGTGTGAAPVIAHLAKEMGILTIGIVNRPFKMEGKKRMINAEKGIQKLKESVDTIIVVPNEKLREEYPHMTVRDAFREADNILYQAAKAISDIINFSGYMNVDFADVRTVTQNRGFALMGTGTSEGENRAVNAAREAMSNPLLADIELENTAGLLINITAGEDFKMDEFEEITEVIVQKAGDEGDIITGLIFDKEIEGKIRVTLIATGLESSESKRPQIEVIKTDKKSSGADISELLKSLQKDNNFEKRKPYQNPATLNQQENKAPKMDLPSFMRKFQN